MISRSEVKMSSSCQACILRDRAGSVEYFYDISGFDTLRLSAADHISPGKLVQVFRVCLNTAVSLSSIESTNFIKLHQNTSVPDYGSHNCLIMDKEHWDNV